MDFAESSARSKTSTRHVLFCAVAIVTIIVSLAGCGPFGGHGSGQSLVNGAGSKPSIVTLEQASRLVSFKLVVPTQVPAGVTLAGVEVSNGTVSSASGASPSAGSPLARLATLLYKASSGKTGSWPYAIGIVETTMTMGPAGVQSDYASRPANAQAPTVPLGVIGPDSQSTESIDGTQVIKSHYDLGGQITSLSYLWKSGGLSFNLNLYDASYSDSTARDIIGSMIRANR